MREEKNNLLPKLVTKTLQDNKLNAPLSCKTFASTQFGRDYANLVCMSNLCDMDGPSSFEEAQVYEH